MKLTELQALLPPFILRLQNAARAFEEGRVSSSLPQYVVEHGLKTFAGELSRSLTGGVRSGKRVARGWLSQQEEARQAEWERGIRQVPLFVASELQSLLTAGVDDVIEKKVSQWRRALSSIRSNPRSMRTGTVIQRGLLLLDQMMHATPKIAAATPAPKSTRDEFSPTIKRKLGNRVGLRCSNPECDAFTSGPATEADRLVHVGVVAHISAAARRGPRFNPELTPKARSSAANGIYLCQTCAKRVDDDPLRYPEAVLRTWKDRAEEKQLRRIGRTAAPLAEVGPRLGWHVDGHLVNVLRIQGPSRVSLALDVPERLTHLRWQLALDPRLEASVEKPDCNPQVTVTVREVAGWIPQAAQGRIVLHEGLALRPREPFDGVMTYALQAEELEKPYTGVLHIRAT